MKRSVVQLIYEQPEWLPHVGWWRVLQVARLQRNQEKLANCSDILEKMPSDS